MLGHGPVGWKVGGRLQRFAVDRVRRTGLADGLTAGPENALIRDLGRVAAGCEDLHGALRGDRRVCQQRIAEVTTSQRLRVQKHPRGATELTYGVSIGGQSLPVGYHDPGQDCRGGEAEYSKDRDSDT